MVLAVMLVASTFDGGYVAATGVMSPTIEPGDRVAIRNVSGGDIRRGDIVVFRPPAEGMRVPESVGSLPLQLRPRPAPQRLMRVVAVGGDHIETRTDRLFVNGAAAQEPYLSPATTSRPLAPTVVPDGAVYILGDNRWDSADSSAFGPVPVDNVEGRVELRYWPFSRLGRL